MNEFANIGIYLKWLPGLNFNTPKLHRFRRESERGKSLQDRRREMISGCREGKREKGSDLVPLRVNINDKKYVVGSLSAEKFPQITFDLVFEKEFELSHDWKNGSVFFCGYMADNPYEESSGDDEFDSEDDDEDLPLPAAENGKVEPKKEEAKPAAAIKGKVAKPESSAKKVTVVEPKKDESDSDDSMEEDDVSMNSDSDNISGSDEDDDSEDDDDSDESDEETPKKPVDKKRSNDSASKTPVPSKKSKVESSQKTDGKKGGHVATPHPSKKPEKTPASNKQSSPKSGAQISCGSCPKKFNSDKALESHTKAKHAAK